jgi:hypothetical protein
MLGITRIVIIITTTFATVPIVIAIVRPSYDLQCAGDLMHIKIFGLHIVIICNYDTASSLMSQASYSDRPILTMVGKLWVLFACSRLDLPAPIVELCGDDLLQYELYAKHRARAIWGALEGDASHHTTEPQPLVLTRLPPQPAFGRTSTPPGAPRASR